MSEHNPATPASHEPGVETHNGFAASIREALTYRDEALRAIALPLGGLGTGTVALAGDGGLRQWQIVNNVNHDAHVPHSFFALWAGRPGIDYERGAVVLQCPARYDNTGFRPAPAVTDHLVPEASRQLLAELPGVDDLTLTAQYPIVEVAYHSTATPATVSLEAFSPFIPLNSADSGLPAILFNFTVQNPTAQNLNVSLLGTQQNLVGWGGKTPIHSTHHPGYGGNVNHLVRLDGLAALEMINPRLDADHPASGSVILAAMLEPGDGISVQPHWDSPRALWEQFSHNRGRLYDQGGSGASLPGQTWNGALAVHFDLPPGAARTVTFLLAWHFPNRYVTWDQAHLGVDDHKSKFWIGNHYTRRFGSALAVAEYVRDQYVRLVETTRCFRDAFFGSSLPVPLLESVAAPVSTLRSPTCLWTDDGRFYGFEGCHGASTTHGALEGCCPLNCTHVWNYELALARLFPDLERTMRRTDLQEQINPQGEIPHRTVLPLYLNRPWGLKIGGPDNPALDGELGTILKTYREVQQGADRAWFDDLWPQVKQVLNHVLIAHDTENDGVIRGEQPNTYDISIYGPNTFIGSLYLAALRAVEAMARLQGEPDLADRLHERFVLGSRKYDELCWNGEYYVQVVDLGEHIEQQFGQGCHIDQLFGQWWAHLLGLGYVLLPDHVRSAVWSIYNHNRRQSFDPAAQRPRVYMDGRDSGLYNCTWPRGGKPAVPTLYSDEVWSGLEYPLACMLLIEGFTDEALKVLTDIRERHNGTRRSPWNEVECGDHYVRPLASWSLLEAALGFHYDAIQQTLVFTPRLQPPDLRSFFITAAAWGTFQQGSSEALLQVAYGQLELRELVLAPAAGQVIAQVDGQAITAAVEADSGTIHLRWPQTLYIPAGSVLQVVWQAG